MALKRAEILSAQLNGGTLLVLAGLIVYEGVKRLLSPPAVQGWTVLAVALVGVVVNLAATWQLAKANRENMAVEGSFQHIVTDLYAFIATAVAATVIIATGFGRADAIASLAVAALMLRASYGLLKNSGRVLLEMAPEGMSADEIGGVLAGHANVFRPRPARLGDRLRLPGSLGPRPRSSGRCCHGVRGQLEQLLEQRFGIDHTTLQVDHQHKSRLISVSDLGAQVRVKR